MNLQEMTYMELGELIKRVWLEVKRRNPIFVNAYGRPFAEAVVNLEEIAEGEKCNPTGDAGPGIVEEA